MARLVIRADKGREEIVRLEAPVTRVGRHTSNDIVVQDPSVSRAHARLTREGDRFLIGDLGSRSGTFVNEARIDREVPLSDGDVIRMGIAEFVYRAGEAVEPAPELPSPSVTTPARFDQDGEPATLNEMSIALSAPSISRPVTAGSSGQRATILSRVAGAIQSVSGLEDLLSRLLDVIFDVFAPDRGVILLCETPTGDLIPKVRRPQDGELVMSRSIIKHAIEHRMALVVADTSRDDRFSAVRSIQAQSIQAAICAPLICRDNVLGALYIDTQLDLLAYGEEDLALLNVIAANAAIAIENAMLLRAKTAASRLPEGEPGPLFAESDAMRAVGERIAELGRTAAPALITGERGTGKLFAAKALHRATGDPQAPFLHIDCLSIPDEGAMKALFGDLAHLPAGPDNADDAQNGGAIRRAAGGTLVLTHLSALGMASQEELADYLAAQAQDDRASPPTRIVATTQEDLEALAAEGRFCAPLARRLCANTLQMPRLIDRKEDVLPLAHYFLSTCDQRTHEYEHKIGASAEHALRRLQFRHKNVAELREAVEFAATIAEGPVIGSEHIFTGPQDPGYRTETDVAQLLPIQWLTRRGVVSGIQTAVLLFFLAIAAVCLTAAHSLAGRIANGLVWGLWWPTLMLIFLLTGRVWCFLCPIVRGGRILSAIGGFKLRPPRWMKKQTGWVVALLFFAIVWNEHIFHMTTEPVATGVFLLTLMGLCAVLSLLYARDVWCRYVCPLGCLSAGYAVSSPLCVHADPSICAEECKNECFKGSDTESGCPMFHHPLYVRDAHFCKLRFSCMRSCPNGSPKLYLRPPLQSVWRIGDLSVTLVPLSLVAFFLTPVMLAAQRAQSNIVEFTVVGSMAVLAACIAAYALPRLLSRDRDSSIMSRTAFALLLLAWGPFMAFHLANVPGLDTLRVSCPEGSVWGLQLPTWEIPLLGVLQLGAILFAALLATITFWRIRIHAAKQGVELVPWGWRALLGLCSAYVLATVLLAFRGVPWS